MPASSPPPEVRGDVVLEVHVRLERGVWSAFVALVQAMRVASAATVVVLSSMTTVAVDHPNVVALVVTAGFGLIVLW